MKVKTSEQLEVVVEMINNAKCSNWINEMQVHHLLSLLNKKASEVGEKGLKVSMGPLGTIGIRKKGSFI